MVGEQLLEEEGDLRLHSGKGAFASVARDNSGIGRKGRRRYSPCVVRRGPWRGSIEEALRAARDGEGSGIRLDGSLAGDDLEEIVARAAAEGFVVHRVAGRRDESELQAAGLGELCRPFLELLPALSDVRRDALAGALALAPAAGASRFAISMAALDLLGAAGSLAPTLIVVEGVRWLDPLSRDVINFVAWRLAGTRIVMLLDSAPPTVEVSLLGRFAIRGPEGVGSPPPRLAGKLLKVVALQGRPVHVDEVVEVLWPGAEPGRGRARLRNAMNRLRTTAGPLVVRSGDTLSIAPEVLVDVTEFTRGVRAVLENAIDGRQAIDQARQALARYRGDLLPDSIYEPWTTEARERLRRQRLTLLDRLRELHVANGELDEALAVAEEALAADPAEELRYVRLGRLLLQLERRSAAAAVVRRARAVLAEMGLEPSPALIEVERDIRAPRSTTPHR